MPDSLVISHLRSIIQDSGPIYAESLLHEGEAIFEPWNAFSSLLIAAPAIYWAWRLRGQYRKYWFLALCMPFLFLNGMGSTFFHATRSSNLLLLMDFLPAAIVTLMVSIYLWAKALPKGWMVVPVILVSAGLRFMAFRFVDPPLSINLSYLVGGLTFLIPLVILLRRTQFKGLGYIIATIGAFAVALLCRQIDLDTIHILPMGTHFLWHAFTGIGGFMMGAYLYSLESNLSQPETKNEMAV